jgi:hypothetical protein
MAGAGMAVYQKYTIGLPEVNCSRREEEIW